ncbi:MAG TPA: GAF domain-containing protein, partial [Anaerolineales bacterium]
QPGQEDVGALAGEPVQEGFVGSLGLNFGAASLAALALLLYVALFDRQASPANRKLAWVLLATEILAGGLLVLPEKRLGGTLGSILASAIFALAYGYASFRQMVSERRLQRGRLTLRLAALALTACIPLLIGLVIFLNVRAGSLLGQEAAEKLRLASLSLKADFSLRLETQSQALQTLSSQADLLNSSPAQQAAALKALAAANPGVVLASLVDGAGRELARSDEALLQDESGQAWFQKAMTSDTAVSQLVKEGSLGQTSLVVAAALRSASGQPVGVSVLRSDPGIFKNVLEAARPGKLGLAYLVDDQLQVAGLSNTSGQNDPGPGRAEAALRSGMRGLVSFTDPAGRAWWAYLAPLDNGWSAIIQQPEAELLQAAKSLERVSVALAALTALLLAGLVWLIVRQALQPIQGLMETVTAIRQGDLNRSAPVESEDELGMLAQAFNSMTGQMRDLITGLEDRVAERSKVMERRAAQLQVASEVSREAASIRNLEQLLEYTAHLISERFGFYHAGIFLLDPGGQYAVLRSASSEGGQRMLAAGHQLKVGQVGIVGHVAAEGEPRVALDVGADAVYFDNPLLPETRSEAALPLRGHDRIIGVLDVQSTQPSAFSKEDVQILQLLADQVALAIENARLITSSQQAFQELEALYGQRVDQSWLKRLANQPAAFAYDRLGVRPGGPQAQPTGPADGYLLEEPIQLRGRALGKLVLRRERELGPWTQQEKELAREAIVQAALSLENARLLEEAQRSALREQQINAITAQVSGSANVETVLQTTARELGKALGAARTYIQITANRS